MKFLIDTNVFIPLEIISLDDLEENTPLAIELVKLASKTKQQLYLHPIQKEDIKNDKDDKRRKIRGIIFNKYLSFTDPPVVSPVLEKELGVVSLHSNDWVDHNLIAALYNDAVDYLITEDQKIIKKVELLGLKHRVVSIAEALTIIKDLLDINPAPPPAVQMIEAYNINESDPIWNSLRKDYPGFDKWLKEKCKREHRPTWIIPMTESKGYGAVCIIKLEDHVDFNINGKILKICCFKVSENCNGFRFGELLLKAVLSYAYENNYHWLYTETFDKNTRLINLFQDFGFHKIDSRTPRGEIRLLKTFIIKEADKNTLDPLSFNKKYGPFVVKEEDVFSYVVPIRPKYHCILFPDRESQLVFFPGNHPFGNSIRKAYLCNSKIRSINPGSNLLFYRTEDIKGITVLGIVEDTLVSKSPDQVARFVGKRTVYKYLEIAEMCSSEVLAILFRQVILLPKAISLDTMIESNILSAHPQQITKASEGVNQWIQKIIKR
ncbi:MAG: GNAT family N-acetyltransferase [Candidatus Scalindua sp.]